MILALLLLQAAPVPSAEALSLGRRLAETGTLATLLPMIAAKSTDELVAQHPELSAEERAELRRVATATFETGKAKLFAAEGRAYAERLSPEDLRVLAARSGDAVSARHRAALLPVIMTTMGAMEGMDLKRDTLATFCVKTGKGCAGK